MKTILVLLLAFSLPVLTLNTNLFKNPVFVTPLKMQAFQIPRPVRWVFLSVPRYAKVA